jgi:hypothetical protein
MENKALILSTVKRLKINFYVWFVILIGLSIFCFNTNYPFQKLNDAVSVNLQQVFLLCMLGGIPGAFIWTKNRMKALNQISDIGLRLRQYEKLVHIRQSIFFILGLFILFMQVFTVMKGVLMLFLMIICLSLFIIPSKSRLETESQLMEP